MQKQDYSKFVSLMKKAAALTALQGNKDPQVMVPAYFEELQAYPFELIEAAIMACCRDAEFFPSLSAILAKIEGTADDQALKAWGIVRAAIRRFGTWESVKFPSPAYHFAIQQLGGWYELAQVETEAIPFRAKEFMQYYKMALCGETWGRIPEFCKGDSRTVYDALTGSPVDQPSALPAGRVCAPETISALGIDIGSMRINDWAGDEQP